MRKKYVSTGTSTVRSYARPTVRTRVKELCTGTFGNEINGHTAKLVWPRPVDGLHPLQTDQSSSLCSRPQLCHGRGSLLSCSHVGKPHRIDD